MKAKTPIGEILTLEYGRSLPAASRQNGDVPVCGSNGRTGWHTTALVGGPTLVVGRKGSIGAVHYEEGPCYPIDTTYFVQPKKYTKMDYRYVFHMLRHARLDKLNSATGVPSLSRDQAYGVNVYFPGIDEQQRVARLLDRAAEIRRRADVARTKARAIIPALFLDMFGDPATNPKGWDIEKLGRSTRFIGGSSLPDGIEFFGQSNGHLHCKVSTLALPENQYGVVTALEWSELPGARSAVAPPNSILFPKRGAAIATNRKRLLRRSASLDPNLMGVLGKAEIYDGRFLLSLFETMDLTSISSGSTVPQLNKQDLAPLEFMVPPLPLQTAFAEQVTQIEAVARALDAAAAKAEAMAAALSAEVFG